MVRFGMLILNPMISTVIKKQRSGPVLRAVLARGGDVWNVFEISINGMSTPVQDTENADFEITGLVAVVKWVDGTVIDSIKQVL